MKIYKTEKETEKMKENAKVTSKALASISIVGILCALVTTVLLPAFTFRPQKYTDLIYGLATLGTCKSGELFLYKGMLFVGIVAGVLLIIRVNRTHAEKENKQCHTPALVFGGALFLHAGLYFLSHTYSLKLFYFTLIGLWMYGTRKELWKKYVLLLLTCYYNVTGLFLLYVFIFQFLPASLYFGRNVSQIEIILASFVLFMGAVFIEENLDKGECSPGWLDRCILVLQLAVPANMLVYLRCRYAYGQETVVILFPEGYTLFILAITLLLEWMAVSNMRKNIACSKERKETGMDHLIAGSSVLTILVMNSFIVPAQIIPTDSWHHGEQITQWQQVVDLGQKLYVDFCPSSGNFSMPIGFLLRFLCGNTGSGYQAAYALVGLLVALFVGALLIRHLPKEKTLLLAALSGLPIYDRGYLLLPSFLLLLLPAIIEDRSKWIKTWIVVCFLNGLYYPTFGGAFLLATLPYGIVQIWSFFQSGEWKEKRIKVGFWMGWLLLLLLLLLSIPLLYRMANHILGLAKYSLQTDSFTILGNAEAPEGFLIRLPQGIRYALYVFCRVCIPMINVLIPMTLCLALLIKNKDFCRERLFFVLSGTSIMQIVAYSYTLLRADAGVLCSRTFAVILPAVMCLFVGVSQDAGKFLSHGLKNKIVLFCIFFASVGIVSISNLNFPNTENGTRIGGLVDDAPRMTCQYQVSEVGFVRLNEDQIKRFSKIGDGFVQRSVLKNLEKRKDFTQQYGIQNKSYVNYNRLSLYVNQEKACYLDSTFFVRSTEGQRVILQSFAQQSPIVVEISPDMNYEIVKWMEQKGYCRLENNWYMSKEDIVKYQLQDKVTDEYVMASCKEYGLVPSAWGDSWDTLTYRFQDEMPLKVEKGNRLTIPDVQERQKYDYLYLEIDRQKSDTYSYETDGGKASIDQKLWDYFHDTKRDGKSTVTLWFDAEDGKEKAQVSMAFGNGKLLIPLGYHADWRHAKELSEIVLDFSPDEKACWQLKEAKLLQSAIQ